MFSTIFTNYTCIYRDIPYLNNDVSKGVCYRCVVCGKGLWKYSAVIYIRNKATITFSQMTRYKQTDGHII